MSIDLDFCKLDSQNKFEIGTYIRDNTQNAYKKYDGDNYPHIKIIFQYCLLFQLVSQNAVSLI